MIPRLVNLPNTRSFFLFGARGTGKTSLLREHFSDLRHLWIDLLTYTDETTFSENPDRLSEIITRELKSGGEHQPLWVVIDEVQKIPKLLDVVQLEIEKRGILFALTGSSARKLKRGSGNMLAGRATLRALFPFTYHEIGGKFDLSAVLRWGTLPAVFNKSDTEERIEFLEDYVSAYLQEEVFAEQLARNIQPFRKFLRVAAQMNGRELNYAAIGRDLGIDTNTVRSYFEILEDTLVGFRLSATERSFRKQQLAAPKFYLFDTGVRNAIDGSIRNQVLTSQEQGALFEHFFIAEFQRLASYKNRRLEISYLRTKGGLEVDLVVDEVGAPTTLIEIKASSIVRSEQLLVLESLRRDFPEMRAVCVCREPLPRIVNDIEVMPWELFLNEFFHLS